MNSTSHAAVVQPPKLSAATRICAVYGHPIKHSASPAMQNAGIAALGLDWRYVAFDVSPDELPQAIRGAAAMRFIGLNLTVPHKLLALPCVDVLDESARTWGAVNTIRFEIETQDAGWQPLARVAVEAPGPIRSHGFNTDADAIFRSIEEDLGLALNSASSVLVLGAGGAGRTAALRLAAAGAGRLFLVNRTQAKAETVRDEIASRFPGCSATVGYPSGEVDVDLLLNATSLGLSAADPLPYDPAAFDLHRAATVYDMIYRPAETPLLKAARLAGRKSSNGLGMLLHQGARALEIWSGSKAPSDLMRRALHENICG